MNTTYDDIINLPHHESKRHPRMSLYSRAAQFAPFAALTGHDAAIDETARLTVGQRILSQDEMAELDSKLKRLLRLHMEPTVEITFFQPDERKAGGTYRTVRGTIKKVDEIGQVIILDNGTAVPVQAVSDISGDCLDKEDGLTEEYG